MPDGNLESLPLVSVRLACNKKHQKIWALIDSGADVCVFNSDIAALLNINPPTGKQFDLFGFVGGGSPAWLHQVNLTLNGYPSIDILVAFTDSIYPELPLLGQRGFFDNFQIRFHRYRNQIEIYPKSSSI
jgi:hypothetical protein